MPGCRGDRVDSTRVEDPWLSPMDPFENIAAYGVNLEFMYVRANRFPEDVYDNYEEAIETDILAMGLLSKN